MNRDEIIEWLIADALEIIRDGAGGADLLYEGFKGYKNYTDEELRDLWDEYQQNGELK